MLLHTCCVRLPTVCRRLTAASGDVAQGNFRAGKLEGRATLTYAAGGGYEGEFRNSKKEGRGVETTADGGGLRRELLLTTPSSFYAPPHCPCTCYGLRGACY